MAHVLVLVLHSFPTCLSRRCIRHIKRQRMYSPLPCPPPWCYSVESWAPSWPSFCLVLSMIERAPLSSASRRDVIDRSASDGVPTEAPGLQKTPPYRHLDGCWMSPLGSSRKRKTRTFRLETGRVVPSSSTRCGRRRGHCQSPSATPGSSEFELRSHHWVWVGVKRTSSWTYPLTSWLLIVDLPPAANEFPTKVIVGAIPSTRNEPIMLAIAFRSVSSAAHT